MEQLRIQKQGLFSKSKNNRFNNYRLKTQFTALPAGSYNYIAA